MSHCYFAFIFYSIADVFYIINFISLLHFILRRMCVCHMFNNVLTYLLTYLLTITTVPSILCLHETA